jgi:hypothetical protein
MSQPDLDHGDTVFSIFYGTGECLLHLLKVIFTAIAYRRDLRRLDWFNYKMGFFFFPSWVNNTFAVRLYSQLIQMTMLRVRFRRQWFYSLSGLWIGCMSYVEWYFGCWTGNIYHVYLFGIRPYIEACCTYLIFRNLRKLL